MHAGSPRGKGLMIEVKAIDGLSMWPVRDGSPDFPENESPELWEQMSAALDELSDDELSRLIVSRWYTNPNGQKRKRDVTVGSVILTVSMSMWCLAEQRCRWCLA